MSGNAARAGWKIPKGRWYCQQARVPFGFAQGRLSIPFGWLLTGLRMTGYCQAQEQVSGG